MAAGHHNGFNPFRDAHGRWAAPGAAATKNDAPVAKGGAMNDSLRSASGRATGSTGGARAAGPAGDSGAAGGGSGGSGGGGGKTVAHATPAVLSKVDAQPVAKGQALHPATNAKLNDIMQTNDWQGTMHASYDGLNGAAFSVLSQSRGQATKEVVDTLISAYKETGFDPPSGASHADLLAYMDSYKGVPFGSAAEANRTSYGIALALKAGNQGVAQTLSDGREGAGVGWDYQRQELGADLEAENLALYGTA